MNRISLLKITNITLFISMAIEIATGRAMLLGNVIVRFGLFDLAFKVHKYNGFVLVVLVLMHIYQNWGWVRANILKIKR